MEFSGKFAEGDLVDLARLERSRWHWLWYAVINWELILQTVALFAGTIITIWYHRAGLGPIAMDWGIIVSAATWNAYAARRRRRREVVQVNARRPDTIGFETSGLMLNGPGAARDTDAWDRFTGWRERRRVILLERHSGLPPIAFSTAGLPDGARQYLRELLGSHLPRVR